MLRRKEEKGALKVRRYSFKIYAASAFSAP
jgi:hypothetical protein